VEAVQDAEQASQHVTAALRRLIGFETGFDIDTDAVINSLRDALKDAETKVAQ
jgi:hypothetical protein